MEVTGTYRHIPGARRRLGETGRYSCGNKQPYDRSQIPPSRRFGAGSSATKQKIDAGTRRQIIATAQQLWNKTKSDLTLAKTTYDRILTLYKDSVVTSQRKDEVEAMYKAAVAAERAAYEQYQMAVDGAQSEDKASARSLVNAARSTVDEVTSLLMDARLTAPEDGQIATIFPKRGELVAPGTPIMNLVVMSDVHAVLNVREDLMPNFRIGGKFVADVPAIARKM